MKPHKPIPIHDALKEAEDKVNDAYWDGNAALGDAWNARAEKLRKDIERGEEWHVPF